MIKLSGILEFSMGNFLCLRGYVDYKTLSKISKENKDVQRELIEKHKGEMATFLNVGEYRFFPEVVLSVSLLSNNNYAEVGEFFTAISSRSEWNKKLGEINISIFNHDAGDKNRVAHITFDEAKVILNRIDGNHRLSAADEVVGDFKVPYCLILCQNTDEEGRYSRAIFHNINAKQIPLNLEETLKVIIESPQVFSDDKLKNDPSFGWNFYLCRKIIKDVDFEYFPLIAESIRANKYSFFVELFKYLLENGTIQSDDTALTSIKNKFTDINQALRDSGITSITKNVSVIGALIYYSLTNNMKYSRFLSWIKKNNIGNVENLKLEDVINLYDEIYKHVPQKVFLARWYPNETNSAYSASLHRLNALKEVINELGLELTDLGTRETSTFDIREVMYRDIRECDIFIADLSSARHNVMIEVGYALKHIDTNRMIFYFQETDIEKNVPFDVSHLSYDKITDSAEIKTKIKARIKTILEQAGNGEI